MPPTITSPRNQRVLEAMKLRDRRGREKQNRIIIDGARELLRALEADVELDELFVCLPLCGDESCCHGGDLEAALDEAAQLQDDVRRRGGFCLWRVARNRKSAKLSLTAAVTGPIYAPRAEGAARTLL